MRTMKPTEIPPEVAEVIARSKMEPDRIRLPGSSNLRGDKHERLSPELYKKVDSFLRAHGGRWDRKTHSHIFECDPREALGLALDAGSYIESKKALAQFDSPPAVARRVVAALGALENGARVLEPSVGPGALLHELARAWPGTRFELAACEIDPTRGGIAAQRFGMELDESQPPAVNLGKLTRGDFLQTSPKPLYDRVLMNPPFTDGNDTDHVVHAWRFLRHPGKLVAVMSPGWTFRAGKRFELFRELYTVHGGYHEELPPDSFRESGTNVRSLLVTIQARRPAQ